MSDVPSRLAPAFAAVAEVAIVMCTKPLGCVTELARTATAPPWRTVVDRAPALQLRVHPPAPTVHPPWIDRPAGASGMVRLSRYEPGATYTFGRPAAAAAVRPLPMVAKGLAAEPFPAASSPPDALTKTPAAAFGA